MQYSLLRSIVFVALGTVGAANAADMPVKAPLYYKAPWLGSDIIRSNNQVSLDFIETYDHYAEHLDPNRLGYMPGVFDSEKGWLPGLSATASVMRDFAGIRNAYLSGRFSWVQGKNDYWSAPQQGKSNADIQDWDFRLGKGFDVSPNAMITPYFGAGAHDWRRDLTPLGPSGYHEHYSNGYAGGGILFQYSIAPGLVLSANGLIGSTFDSHISVDSFPNPPSSFATPLGNSVIYMVGAAADYAITKDWHANIGVDWLNFRYGESPLLPPGARYEPDSKTSSVTTRVGFGYAF